MNNPRHIVLALGLAATTAALAQAVLPSFTINGKSVKLETVEKNGKIFVDATAAFKALGASVTYKAGTKSFVIVSTGQNVQQDVQGTAQLAGGEGKFGATYSLGKESSKLNFTLKSAEYTVARVNIGNSAVVPNADEKLLVLHFTVQNPQKNETHYYWGDLRFTAVDAQDVNRVFAEVVGREGTTEPLEVNLKPAQKIDVYTAIKVPAAGVVPKLIVERGDGSPVLRFDLRGGVKGLAAPLADPADPSGATARQEVPATTGSYYPLQKFDARLESAAYTTSSLNNRAPGQGKRYLAVTVGIKNATTVEQHYYAGTFLPELRDADGEKVEYNQALLKASRDEPAEGNLKPGEEYRVRFFFELPQNVAARSLTLREENTSRAYTFDLSNLK